MPNGAALHRNKTRGVRAVEAARCLELQLSGMSIRRIAETVGLSTGTVQSRIKEALAAVIVPPVEEMRKREGERLLELLDRLQPAVDAGTESAIKLAATLSASYRKLYGLNAPEQHQYQITQTTQEDLAYIDLINEARARMHQEEAQLKEQS